MHDQINAQAKTILWVLFAASGLLFVIACSNVANLVLARTVRRESELAVRSALGAEPAALRRSLLAESLVLCGSGAVAALVIAWPMVAMLGRYAARFSVRAEGLTLDFSLVWIGIALALVAAVFLAFIPRLPAEDAPMGTGLTSSGLRVTGGSKRRLRIFAVTQITASFLLLAGAAVLMRTLYAGADAAAVTTPRNVLAVNLPVMSYGRTPQQVEEFYHDVQRASRRAARRGARVGRLQRSVARRCRRWISACVCGAGRPGAQEWAGRFPRAKFRSVSPGYFETLGMPILAGRDFRDADKDGSERVVIVSQSLAKTLFPGQDAREPPHLRGPIGVIKFIGISDRAAADRRRRAGLRR